MINEGTWQNEIIFINHLTILIAGFETIVNECEVIITQTTSDIPLTKWALKHNYIKII